MLKQQLNNKSNSVAVSTRRHKHKIDSPNEQQSLDMDISLVHDSIRLSKFKNNQRYNNNSQLSDITTINPET
jgi:hypothetical protein